MIRHHLTFAFRHLAKNKLYTTLNLFGLSIGLACFALIATWVHTELGYDRFHQQHHRIYRVVSTFTDASSVIKQAVTSPPLAPALAHDFPEVEHAVRIDPTDAVMAAADKSFLEQGIITDPSFFNIFDFRLLSGNRHAALNEPYSVVLSQSMAKKYFGDTDPVGQLVKIYRFDPDGNGAQFKVTGVIEDCPANSQFFYDFVISFKTWETARPAILEPASWFNPVVYTYILLSS